MVSRAVPLTMTTRFIPTNIRSAIEVVKTDSKQTTNERDAFATFTDCISNLDVATVGSLVDKPQQPSIQLLVPSSHASTAATTTEEVCDIYHETVMAVDHYAEVYDDTLEESLAQEFGPEVAIALTTTDQLTPHLRKRLIECSQQARESRRSLLQGLKTEYGALETADEELIRLGSGLDDVVGTRSFENWTDEELVSIDECLCSRKRGCKQLLIDRQAILSEQRIPSTHRISHEFSEYLYEPLSVTYPIITDGIGIVEMFRTAQQNIEQALTNKNQNI